MFSHLVLALLYLPVKWVQRWFQISTNLLSKESGQGASGVELWQGRQGHRMGGPG